MRKKLVFAALLVLVTVPALVGSPKIHDEWSSRGGCPKGSHLINCPQGSFCCPDGALCFCGPY
jgi:hypothetical protein